MYMYAQRGISFARASKIPVQFANNIFRMTDCLQNIIFSCLMKYFSNMTRVLQLCKLSLLELIYLKQKNVVNEILKLNEPYFLLQ